MFWAMPTLTDDEFEFEELDSVALRELDAIEASAPQAIVGPKLAPKSKPDRATRISQLQQLFQSSETSTPSASSSSLTVSDSTQSFCSTIPKASGSTYDTAIRVLEDDPTPSHSHLSPSPNQNFSDAVDYFEIDEHALREIDEVENTASNHPFVPPKLTGQTTLTGGILPEPSRRPFSRTKSKNAFPDTKPPAMTKTWEHAGFAKTGLKPVSQKGKGKRKAEAGEEEEDLEVDAEQLLASAVLGQ